ncbi:EEV glycoprotein [Pseudocowpox virus]|uniref:Protein OPG161 n=1 Tax=Pseudocowpox virus TaxID=129726 RepID=D3IZC7_9POXV|nr:EEV glycoprotein [Pseudocowpox virus]
MAHNTFEADSESGNNNANYVASVKRQKMIRRYLKMFFRFVAAIAIIVLAILVVLLALDLDHCKEESKKIDHHSNRTCEGLFPENKWCLVKHYSSTWNTANTICSGLGQALPSKGMVKEHPWLGQYLTGTWSDNGDVFESTGNTVKVWSGAGPQEKDFFCVS